MSEEIKTILEEMRFKASIYRDHKKRGLSFNDEEKNCALLLDYIQQKENIIKEVRECIEDYPTLRYSSMDNSNGNKLTGKLVPTDKLLEILNKETK